MNVNWTASAPETFARQTSCSPDRVDVNVTWRPSGAKCAIASRRVEEIATAGGEVAGAPGDGVSMRQTLASV
jgi:hypothetical protein